MKNVMVIGGTGYIGSHLVERLIHERIKLTVLVPQWELTKPILANWAMRGTAIAVGDCTNIVELSRVTQGMDTILYLAGVRTRNTEALKKIYVEAPASLASFAKKSGVSHFIFVSNTTVYGDHGDDDVTENSELKPNTGFSNMMVQAEAMVAENGPLVSIVRLPAVFGKQVSGRVVLPSATYVEKGTNWMNYVHVKDVSSVLCEMVNHPVGGIFNVSDGHPIRHRDLSMLIHGGFGRANMSYDEARLKLPSVSLSILTTSCKLNTLKIRTIYPHKFTSIVSYLNQGGGNRYERSS